MICLVLDQSIANRNVKTTTLPILNNILSTAEINMNLPCLLVTYHVGSAKVRSRASLADSLKEIAEIQFDHLSPMANPLMDALFLAYNSLKNLVGQRHIIVITNTLFSDGFSKPTNDENITSMETLLEKMMEETISLSILCKKGLKPIEELSTNGWKLSNPNYTVIMDKLFVNEIPSLSQGNGGIPASVTYGDPTLNVANGNMMGAMGMPIHQNMHMAPGMMIPQPQDYYPGPNALSEHQSPEMQPSFAPTSPLWTGQIQLNDIVSSVIATPISKHDPAQLYFILI
eukprot:NODE_19_length_47148_cov_1.447810.p21 type:complete len:286 gc:universal NODE_19_length_47148_cov_1.447810:25478-24621(-)